MSLSFCNWDGRPAILSSGDASLGAVAKLRPNGPWEPVDARDVFSTAGIMTEEACRERFRTFGWLDVEAAASILSPAAAAE